MHKKFFKIKIFSWALKKSLLLANYCTDKNTYFLDLNVITNTLIFSNCFALSNRLYIVHSIDGIELFICYMIDIVPNNYFLFILFSM